LRAADLRGAALRAVPRLAIVFRFALPLEAGLATFLRRDAALAAFLIFFLALLPLLVDFFLAAMVALPCSRGDKSDVLSTPHR
jgi:hypothetical protein